MSWLGQIVVVKINELPKITFRFPKITFPTERKRTLEEFKTIVTGLVWDKKLPRINKKTHYRAILEAGLEISN